MGLGKTRQAIMAAREGGARGVLIVCPASLKINWKREINSVYPEDFSEAAQDSGHMNEVMIIDSKSDLPAPSVPEWYVINYDILEKKRDLIDFLIDHKIVDTLILDEAHYIKGKSIRATTVVGGALKGTRLPGMANRVSRLYCLTGTPLLNRPIELFNLLRAIKHPLGSNRQKFATRYCNAFYMVMVRDNLTGRQFLVQSVENAYKYYGDRSRYTHLYRFLNESGSSHLDELREQMKGYILRRTKKEVMDLPEKIVSTIENELTPDQKKIYDRAWEDYLAVIKEGDPDPEKLDNIMLARHLVEIQKLKQICSRAKVALISADIRNAVEQGEKVIVFSQYTETIRQLKDELSKEPKGSEAIKSVTLTGENDQD
jgi:SWI/SNF-related matrix-associated actin-dependent regulator 1 of chromatin subfamily A